MLSEMEKFPSLAEVLSVRDSDYLSRNLMGLNGMRCKLPFFAKMNVLFLEQNSLRIHRKNSVKNFVLSHAGGTISRDIIGIFII